MDVDLDCEQVIFEVEKHPCLYDVNDESFKNRVAKMEAWKRVTEGVVGKPYTQAEYLEQCSLVKDVQKKWKSLKDGFARSQKNQHLKTAIKANKRRPYIYQQQMSFLLHVMDDQTISDNEVDPLEPDEIQDEDQSMPFYQKQSPEPAIYHKQSPEPTIETTTKIIRESVPKPKETLETKILKILTEYNNSVANCNQSASATRPVTTTSDDDFDRMFLLSLLPKLKQLNSNALLDFQIKSMQLLQQYLSEAKNLKKSPKN